MVLPLRSSFLLIGRDAYAICIGIAPNFFLLMRNLGANCAEVACKFDLLRSVFFKTGPVHAHCASTRPLPLFGLCGLIQWHCHWIKPQIQVQEAVPPGGNSKGTEPLVNNLDYFWGTAN
jgi:hypothetical protein